MYLTEEEVQILREYFKETEFWDIIETEAEQVLYDKIMEKQEFSE